jgi:hypothetical protein
MISGVPLFRGRDNNDQLNAIIKVVGTPDERTFRKIMQDSVSTSFSFSPGIKLMPVVVSPKCNSANFPNTLNKASKPSSRAHHHSP